MSIKTMKTAALATILAATAALALTSGAQAYQCKTQPEMGGVTAANYGAAMSTAQAVWTSKVRSTHGLEWSVLSIATGKAQACQPAAGGTYCQVVATPCKYVVP